MITALVLVRRDMFDVEDERMMLYESKMAILAAITGALADESSQGRVDHG